MSPGPPVASLRPDRCPPSLRQRGPRSRDCRAAIRRCRCLPLLELVRRIVERGDREALRELHDSRAAFRDRNGAALRLAEFLQRLRDNVRAHTWARSDAHVLDLAYDLTLDKFSNLPRKPRDRERATAGQEPRETGGPDCRLYFRAFLDYAESHFRATPPAGEFEREEKAARLLQRLVHKHFRLSCAEAMRREMRLVRRYTWRVDGRVMRVWMPTELTGRQCRQWLEHHVSRELDLSGATAEEAVQALVRRRLGERSVLRLDNDDSIIAPGHTIGPRSPRNVRLLADGVAAEKAERFTLQRPAIAALGPARLVSLIQRIFEDLEAGDLKEGQLAREFGLTKAAFSRFAGSRWPHRCTVNPGAGVPDLWRNTAQAVAACPELIDAAATAGVWEQIERVLRHTRPTRTTHGNR